MRPLVALLLAATALAGCFGLSTEGLQSGDEVMVHVQAVSLTSGLEILDQELPPFVMGSGGFILGADLERALVGLGPNETLSTERLADPAQAFPEELRLDLVHRLDRTFQHPQADLGGRSIGDTFEATDLLGFRVPITYSVEAAEGADFTLRAGLSEGPSRHEAGSMGGHVRTEQDDTTITFHMEPVVGHVFFTPDRHPLGLPLGALRVAAVEDDQVVLDVAPGDQLAAFYGQDVRYEIRVVATERPAMDLRPLNGNYGAGHSPVLVGARPVLAADDAAPDADHDDGHGDHSH